MTSSSGGWNCLADRHELLNHLPFAGAAVLGTRAKSRLFVTAITAPGLGSCPGSLEGQRAKKGVLITTSQFSKDAVEYVGRIEKRTVLIDGEQLAELMTDHDIEVAPVASYAVKKVDLDCFEED